MAGLVGVVEAVRGVGHKAAVGEHAVVADLDELHRGDHDRDVEEAARADADPGRIRRGEPDVGLEQGALPHLEPARTQGLEHVALDRPARERARRAISRWMASRFHGRALRSYQRHF